MKNDERNWRKKQFENHNILNNKQKEEIKKAFDMFDGNGSGIIEASNLKGKFSIFSTPCALALNEKTIEKYTVRE